MSSYRITANRRSFVRAIGASAAAAALAHAAARPNVVILFTDDQGYGDLSCHGNPVLKTPNMDRLHSESVRFTDFHASPMCTPARGQLMSGVDALRNRATSVTAGRAVLRRDLPTMAGIFAANGYRTGIFGKWHLGDNYPYRPMDRGFQVAKYHLGFGMSSAPEFGNDYFNGAYRDKGVRKKFQGYCCDFWFQEAMAFMKESQSRRSPFLCYLATNTPHGPAWVDAKYSAPYRKPGLPAEYYGMLANLDENLGKLEAFLQESGLRGNTIFIFMTDNGATAGARVFNAGMRGTKTQIYDGGHRVPCFFRWPEGKLRAPGDVSTPGQLQDILPTLVDLCSLKLPANARFDGKSLAADLRGTGTVGDRMMVVQYGQIPKKWESNVIWGKWRLVHGKELYDFPADPGEQNDLAAAHPEVVAKMRDHYERWWAGVEPGLQDPQPISVGSRHENPTMLCSADWWEIYADNPGHVSDAVGGPRGGPWTIFVESNGEYEIKLARWSFDLNLPLTAGREPQKMTAGSLPKGKAMPIAGAKLTVAGEEMTAKTQPADTFASFRVKLRRGTRTRLHGWFTDASGADLCGAFYASVRKL
jgi:arylsulfatase